ncbi:MAG: type IX secretion system protein PorQ [Mariniphaga sp.]|nr:type IX secretion system protein PorQ [Mariniphaga sp.]MDD4426038.1 type IX secretion system protein PorQ [Mariniphaga sp.]
MKHKIYLCLFLILVVFSGRAQIGGETTYQFLELTNSARVAALGGTQIALTDSSDLNLPFHNPALLDKGMHNHVLANYVNYFADINFGYASYARHFNGIGNFALGVHYINYGDFKEASEQGELTGIYFNAAEYAVNLIYSDRYGRLSYGINLKPVFSNFESYRSFGLAADLGVNYSSKDNLTHVALVARNMGTQVTTYYQDGNREPIPLNVQAGISTRLKYAPLIFSLTMQHLNNWDLAWSESEKEQTLESWYVRKESFTKQVMRHVVLGAEILPSDNFVIRAGYNYQRRQELKFDERLSTVGFSMGFGLKINRFRFDFATSRFHLAGSSNLFSLAINLNQRF